MDPVLLALASAFGGVTITALAVSSVLGFSPAASMPVGFTRSATPPISDCCRSLTWTAQISR